MIYQADKALIAEFLRLDASGLEIDSQTITKFLMQLGLELGLEFDSSLSASKIAKTICRSQGRTWREEHEADEKGISAAGFNLLIEIATANLPTRFASRKDDSKISKFPNWRMEELMLAAELVSNNDWKPLDDNDPRVLRLSRVLNSANYFSEFRGHVRFRSPSSVALKTQNIAQHHQSFVGRVSNGGRLDKEALLMFTADPEAAIAECVRIREEIQRQQSVLNNLNDFDEIVDSCKSFSHTLEMNRESVRYNSIQDVLLDAMGKKVTCGVCDLDIFEKFGSLGSNIMQVHVKPGNTNLNKGISVTSMFELVCANCHILLHRHTEETSESLKAMLSFQLN